MTELKEATFPKSGRVNEGKAGVAETLPDTGTLNCVPEIFISARQT